MSSLSEKARRAACQHLEQRGYTVLDASRDFPAGGKGIVAEDGDALVFASVRVRDDVGRGFPPEVEAEQRRTRYEAAALAYLAEHDDIDSRPVRFDDIALVVLGSDRAMLRHHINVLGGPA